MTLAALLSFLQETAQPGGPATPPKAAPNLLGDMMVPLLLFVVVFYFLMWRPQSKERKVRAAMLAALKKGDKVVLTCGLVGEIAALTEQEVMIRFDDKDQRRLRFKRYAIHSALQENDAPAESDPKSEPAGDAKAK